MARDWADYTPTAGLDYTPTPWNREMSAPIGGLPPGGFAPFAPPSMNGGMFAFSGPNGSLDAAPLPCACVPSGADSEFGMKQVSSQPSQVGSQLSQLSTLSLHREMWPATPTPSGDALVFNFGGMDCQRSEQLAPLHMLPGMGMQPPPRMGAIDARICSGGTEEDDGSGMSTQMQASRGITPVFEESPTGGASKARQPPPVPPPPMQPTVPQEEFQHTGPTAGAPAHEAMHRPSIDSEPAAVEEALSKSSMQSRGSAMHGSGKCRPCAWFHKPQGCTNALDCGYCHMCPDGELKSRKKAKVAAMRMGALAPARAARPGRSHSDFQEPRVLKLSPLI